jgi:hypothetical protein
MVVAAFLPWVKVDYGRLVLLQQGLVNTSASGVSSSNGGKITLVVGIVLIVAAVVVAVGSSPGLRRGMSTAALVVAALGVIVVVLNLANKTHLVDQQLSADLGRAPTPQERLILDRLGFELSFGVGIYIAGVGALIGLAGGVMGLAGRSAAPAPTMASGTAETWTVGGTPSDEEPSPRSDPAPGEGPPRA